MCSIDVLNLSVQHLFEAQLILYSYCEAIHLTIHNFQKLANGLKSLAKVVIDLYLISDIISERGLIPVKILPITTLWEDVEGKARLVPSRIEALIRMESNGIYNEIHVLTHYRATDTHMSCVSALFTCHAGINHFEVIETRIFKFLH
jgi:hypothetical protein